MTSFGVGVRIVLVALLGITGGACAWAQSLAGHWRSELPGGVLTLRIDQRGNVITGVIESAGRRVADLSGELHGDRALGSARSPDGTGRFEAQVRRDALTLVLAQDAGPAQQAARVALEFRRAASALSTSPSPPVGAPPASADVADALAGDARLVGRWSSQDVIVSGGASMASERLLAFGADGNVSLATGRAAAGGAGWSFDGGAGGGAERGRWRARDGVLYVQRPDGAWMRMGRYGLTDDGRILRIVDDAGGRTLWARR
jgi:hypothetical protein